jgi:hypothetical protein
MWWRQLQREVLVAELTSFWDASVFSQCNNFIYVHLLEFQYLNVSSHTTLSILPYLLKCKTRFFFTVDALRCQVVLNSRIRSQTKSLWIGPWAAKPRHVSPNHHVWSVLFWDITQSRVVIPYQCFGTTYQSQLQG